MGKNVSPTIKLLPQQVAVAMLDPMERTDRGKSSDCCQGTLPRPRAYAETYMMIDARMKVGQVLELGAGMFVAE